MIRHYANFDGTGVITPLIQSILYLTILTAPSSCTEKNDHEDSSSKYHDSELIESMDSAVMSYASDKNYSGVVLVADSAGVVMHKAYGDGRNPTDRNIAFWIASGTKFITGLCILKLNQDGLLSEDDPISKYIENVPSDKRTITIKHLLFQTSGLTSSFVTEGITNREDAVELILQQDLVSETGEEFNYSNDNYILLAAIVEKITGLTWEDYVTKYILIPADMTQTGFWGHTESMNVKIDPINDSAKFQSFYEKIFRYNKPLANWGQKGASGIFSTTSDLLKLHTSIKHGRILEEKSINELFSFGFPVVAENDSTISYGHGCIILKSHNIPYEIRIRGHGDWLHTHQISILPNGYTVIVWAKDYGPNNKILAYDLCKELVSIVKQSD